MAKDVLKELERLEAQLMEEEKERQLDALLEQFLEEEDEDEDDYEYRELPPDAPRNFANGYGTVPQRVKKEKVYNADPVELPMDEYMDPEEDDDYIPPRRSLTGLLVTAAGLLCAIIAVLVFCVIRYL